MPKMSRQLALECARSAIANFVACSTKANYDAAVKAIVKCGKSSRVARTMLEKRCAFARTFAPMN